VSEGLIHDCVSTYRCMFHHRSALIPILILPCSVARGREVEDLRSHSLSTGFLSSPLEVTRWRPKRSVGNRVRIWSRLGRGVLKCSRQGFSGLAVVRVSFPLSLCGL
jgi:hypothetical protein